MLDKQTLEKRKQEWKLIKPDKEPDWMHDENPKKPFTDIDSAQAEEGIKKGIYQVVDVRFQYEFDGYHIPGAILIPLPEIEDRYFELDPQKDTLVVCEHGVRSVNASCFLNIMGLASSKIFNLDHGMSSYRGETDSIK